MSERMLEADYVIVGAGAVGMAMADTLTTETSARNGFLRACPSRITTVW